MQVQNSPGCGINAQGMPMSKFSFRVTLSQRHFMTQLGQRHAHNTPINKSKGRSTHLTITAAIFKLGRAIPRPSLGVQDFGAGPMLSLCPGTGTCIASFDDGDDVTYAPPLTYNPPDGRGSHSPVSQGEAMAELLAVVQELKPSGYTPHIVEQTEDYLYLEYASRIAGLIDDVEFWFRPGPGCQVEYRSASRGPAVDPKVNHKRIQAIRMELEKKGWRSTGY
ncbi:hypothetical protein Vretimale_2076 [Volvox reticuliferus]|uniref:Uncharacterized protein n=1 Tax=Volvox reticuliferus TaxID=1737510 RepID=A0A8J4DC61_9CHLO|nr:hypothetical protein Vretifemale_4284 [Volvox reticuliferus]GIL96217.1 hypothetical protein Vretimale_2076 [Volvox reticuliferus]